MYKSTSTEYLTEQLYLEKTAKLLQREIKRIRSNVLIKHQNGTTLCIVGSYIYEPTDYTNWIIVISETMKELIFHKDDLVKYEQIYRLPNY